MKLLQFVGIKVGRKILKEKLMTVESLIKRGADCGC